MRKELSLLKLAIKKNKKFSKKILFLIIIQFLFLLILIPTTTYKSLSDSVNRIINSLYDFRIIQVEDVDKYANNPIENEHIIKTLYNYQDNYYKGAYMFEMNKNSSMDIYPSYDTFTPLVEYGSTISDEYDMICPTNMAFGIYDDENINNMTNMKDYLGKEIKITTYKVNTKNAFTEEEKIEKFPYEYTFKLVGTYDAKYTYSYSSCYINSNTFNNILEETKSDGPTYMTNITALYIDSLQNIKEITSILDENNIKYFITEADTAFMDVILNVSLILTIFTIIVSIIILSKYINIYVKENNKFLCLLTYLGFPRKDIKTILFYSLLDLTMKSFIISIIVTLLFSGIILFILRNNVSYALLKISISLISSIIYTMIVLVISIFSINKEVNKVGKECNL